jgi:OFA family oxalate/formate antiporter-like MFS transporter
MILQAGILYVLGRANDLGTFYIAGAVYGILYGSVQPIVPALSGDYFGTRNMGAIFGMLNAAYMGGAALGPLLAGYVFDITGGYYLAFVITASLAAVAFVLCLLLRRPERKAASV